MMKEDQAQASDGHEHLQAPDGQFPQNSRCALQSTKSSLFSTGLSSMEMLSSRGLSQSSKNTEKKVRSNVLSLQSELEMSRNEIWQEKELCKRLQREKESIQMSYNEQQNELNYTKRLFDSMHAQLEDYKKKIESKTEEVDHLRNDLKKVKKFCKKRYERRSRSRTGEAEDGNQTNTPQSKENKRRVGEHGPRDRRAGLEPLAEKKEHSQKGQRKASQRADPQTSPEPHKSIFKRVRHFFGLRKPKKLNDRRKIFWRKMKKDVLGEVHRLLETGSGFRDDQDWTSLVLMGCGI
ncbi:unnamed protein product [Tetraodon nigroviridis]|uniref:(spotted green pufferfish) hypothetical protein n=1 Tax=Tetraodon nigroviridis TaxID=99883 RepID=Q4RQ09_TETNG|nr:unnamed protein product [Tetraodon nigroviridis]